MEERDVPPKPCVKKLIQFLDTPEGHKFIDALIDEYVNQLVSDWLWVQANMMPTDD